MTEHNSTASCARATPRTTGAEMRDARHQRSPMRVRSTQPPSSQALAGGRHHPCRRQLRRLWRQRPRSRPSRPSPAMPIDASCDARSNGSRRVWRQATTRSLAHPAVTMPSSISSYDCLDELTRAGRTMTVPTAMSLRCRRRTITLDYNERIHGLRLLPACLVRRPRWDIAITTRSPRSEMGRRRARTICRCINGSTSRRRSPLIFATARYAITPKASSCWSGSSARPSRSRPAVSYRCA